MCVLSYLPRRELLGHKSAAHCLALTRDETRGRKEEKEAFETARDVYKLNANKNQTCKNCLRQLATHTGDLWPFKT